MYIGLHNKDCDETSGRHAVKKMETEESGVTTLISIN